MGNTESIDEIECEQEIVKEYLPYTATTDLRLPFFIDLTTRIHDESPLSFIKPHFMLRNALRKCTREGIRLIKSGQTYKNEKYAKESINLLSSSECIDDAIHEINKFNPLPRFVSILKIRINGNIMPRLELLIDIDGVKKILNFDPFRQNNCKKLNDVTI